MSSGLKIFHKLLFKHLSWSLQKSCHLYLSEVLLEHLFVKTFYFSRPLCRFICSHKCKFAIYVCHEVIDREFLSSNILTLNFHHLTSYHWGKAVLDLSQCGYMHWNSKLSFQRVQFELWHHFKTKYLKPLDRTFHSLGCFFLFLISTPFKHL